MQPGPLAPGDREAIATHLGVTPGELDARLVASRGALLGDRRTGGYLRVGTITPARQAGGCCTFLTAEGRCAIHAVAPMGCAYFDAHMDKAEGDSRSIWMHVAISRDEAYQATRARLLERDGGQR